MVWSTQIDSGAWVNARLAPFGTGGASVVPHGFQRYARVLHPAGGQGDEAGTQWSVVAGWSGASVSSVSTWLDVALPRYRPNAPLPWNGSGPDTGAYPSAVSAGLLDVLIEHTADPADVWAGLWEGWGELSVPPDVPRLHHPARAYVLRHGSLTETARTIIEPPWPSRPPNLWWPGDRSWCVASEIDADHSYVGGSASLIDTLVAHPGLEAHPIDPAAASLALTAPSWLATVLARTEAQLRDAGEAVVELSRGTLIATLRPPRRGRSGKLTITRVDDHGGTGGSAMPLRTSNDIDTQLSSALLWSTYELTT